MTTPWSKRYAQRTKWVSSSTIRELLKITEKGDIISFAGGLPAPEVFPVKEFQAACRKVLQEMGPKALQYSATDGYIPLREMIIRHMARYDIKVGLENVMITSGSQQALDLIGKMLINPGDRLLVEEPTYLGALQAFNIYQADYVTVPIDDDGLRVDRLEEALRAGPKFMYLLPNFQNPGGVTLSLDRRIEVIDLAERYGVPIIEDDPYGQLRYEGEHIRPLVVLDSERIGRHDGTCYSGNVIYLSTFSKTLAPGLRLGWVVAPEEVIARLVQLKQGTDLHTSTFNQIVAYEVAHGGFLDEHVRTIRRVYSERRDVMLAALERYFPPDVRWTHPQGGLFLWVTLPEWANTTEMLPHAIEEEKVAYVPGTDFFATGGGYNTMRLNFSNARPEMIEEGIRRLGRVLARQLEMEKVLV